MMNETPSGRIVVGVDGSAPSIDALRRGARLALALRLGLEAITVWESQQILLDYGEIERNPERDAGQALSSVSQIVFGATPPSWFTATCRLGSPIQALIQESERAEMLIVGSRRRNRFWAALTGSVSASCAAGAHCPVLITRGGQSAGDPAAA